MAVIMIRAMRAIDLLLTPINNRLNALPRRERWMIVSASVFVLSAIIYGLLIVPMQRELAHLRTEVPSDREKLATMRVQAQQVATLTAAARPGKVQESARATIERSAEHYGLRAQLKHVQDNSTGLQCTLENVAAGALFEWLQDLSSGYGIRARSALIQALPQTGQVNATLVMKGSTP